MSDVTAYNLPMVTFTLCRGIEGLANVLHSSQRAPVFLVIISRFSLQKQNSTRAIFPKVSYAITKTRHVILGMVLMILENLII